MSAKSLKDGTKMCHRDVTPILAPGFPGTYLPGKWPMPQQL